MPPPLLKLSITVISDVVCPWCFMGKRRVEAALVRLRNENETWRSCLPTAESVGTDETSEKASCWKWEPYELIKNLSNESVSKLEFYLNTRLKGNPEALTRMTTMLREEGAKSNITFCFEPDAMIGSTYRAHMLMKRFPDRSNALMEALFEAYHTRGESPASPSTLRRVGAACGISEREVDEIFYSPDVEAEIRRDVDALRRDVANLSGVPHFTFEFRFADDSSITKKAKEEEEEDDDPSLFFRLEISGAQETLYFTQVLGRALKRRLDEYYATEDKEGSGAKY